MKETHEQSPAAPETLSEEDLDRLLAQMAPVHTSAVLQMRIMADFDSAMARRQAGVATLLRSISDRIWPGAPLWQPACAVAFSLVLGVVGGMLLPVAVPVHDSDEYSVAQIDPAPNADADDAF